MGIKASNNPTDCSPVVLTRFIGEFASLLALQTAHPTASSGSYAIVNQSGTDVIYYFSTADNEWFTNSGGSGASQLSDLTDVEILSLEDGQVLVWDEQDSKWKNQTIPVTTTPSFQETTDVYPITTQAIEVGGLKITDKIDFVTSLITSLRNVSFPDKSGTVAFMDDFTSVLEGIAWKQPAELLFDTALSQSGVIPQLASLTNQGVTLVNNSRVVLMAQANPIYNGIWRVNSTPVSGFYRLYRTNDANTTAELNNAVVGVTSGTHAGKTYRQTAVNPTIGTNTINFVEFGNSTVANATDVIAGIMKLYASTGANIDGTITQSAITDALDLKSNKADLVVKSLNTDVTMNSNVQLNTNLTFPIGANETWVIEFVMSGGCASSGGTRFQVNTPSGASGNGHVQTATAAQPIVLNSPALAIAGSLASQPIRLYMTIRNGATAGNVTLSFASNSNGQTSIVRGNSYFIATKTTIV